MPCHSSLAPRPFHYPLFFATPVTVFLTGPLVVCLFTLGEGNLQLGPASYPVHGRWNQGVAFAFYCPDELVELFPVQQQLAGALWVRLDMGGGMWWSLRNSHKPAFKAL